VGYVPEEIVQCLSAFLDASYIAQHQDINMDALNMLDTAMTKFWELHEIFCTSDVRHKGFSLPRQHALLHYCRLIEDFGAPGGLCSLITESCHITAVKKPWHRSNRYHTLGQMLHTNQWLDKLAAMHSDFISHGMLPAGHRPRGGVSVLLNSQQLAPNEVNGDDDNDDEGPVEGKYVLGHVVLARTPSKSNSMTDQAIPDGWQCETTRQIWLALPFTSVNQICAS